MKFFDSVGNYVFHTGFTTGKNIVIGQANTKQDKRITDGVAEDKRMEDAYRDAVRKFAKEESIFENFQVVVDASVY